MKKPYFLNFVCHLLIALIATGVTVQAQDLNNILDENTQAKTRFVTGAFKDIRVVNLQSTETVAPRDLVFRISHRFGTLNSGGVNLWGLDNASIRLALEYGLSEHLMIGVGRSSASKDYDFFAKAKILRQSKGKRSMPVSLLFMSSAVLNGQEDPPGLQRTIAQRMSFVHQLILGRKFSDRLSLLIAPTLIHRNLVETPNDLNNLWALGFGGRFKLNKRLALNAEYVVRNPPADELKRARFDNFQDSFSIGFDIETGGHVFSLHLTNSLSMIEKGFIAETTELWEKGGIHFGFNISRVFSL
ncbi:DUF5777 family beta-barrel protein [Microscilla marina]|uniref:DUF5777 family beta-barrel protein n=1 Tax=Microscilla marina TaxID=1027 RepID=UPI0005D48376|nr:DUF5777 family beta-barrel protein [Microscilla marina]